MTVSRAKQRLLLTILLASVTGIYANHFHNSFHFDDSHTIEDNPYIRSLRYLPRYFTDATTFSVLPANRTYRPFVSASLAIDYALGHGYHVFWFHLSTFLVFLLQLVAMYALFGAILNKTRPEPDAAPANQLVSLLAVAWYGLHPAMAETLNYIIQRGDIYCAMGVVSALAIYACKPGWRKTGIYLLPLVFALLSKPPAAVFPVLLFLYVAMFEQQQTKRFAQAARAALPSIVVCGLLMALQSAMTPKTFTPSTISGFGYLITQPYVLLRYFEALFLPLHLNVDTDLRPFPAITLTAVLGFAFVAALIALAWLAARTRDWRPVSFGVLWFLVSSLPTSLYRLSEVENDHRMFLPFAGLVLAVAWSIFLVVERLAARLHRPVPRRIAVVCAVLVLAPYAYGTHVRNRVWRSEASLWLDDVQKCPENGRGLMNYGLTQMAIGNYPVALDYFERALRYTPNYKTLEVNLGIVNGALNRPAQSEQHFLRAILLDPADASSHFYYGRWLFQKGNVGDALEQFQTAVRLNPSRMDARDFLALAYYDSGEQGAARSTAAESLRLDPGDGSARALLDRPTAQSADYWMNASLYQYQAGNFTACIQMARQALKISPELAPAYANIGAAYAGLGQWDLAIENERQALRIDPGFQLAKNNLALYGRQKNSASEQPPRGATAEDWLNASLRDYQAGLYQKSIQDAQHALRLRPSYPEAYNNIAAGYAAMRDWDQAIAAAQAAIRLKPDFQLARNNLAWAVAEKARAGAAH
jgi:tetratricopeptide (TPR) repeat protein